MKIGTIFSRRTPRSRRPQAPRPLDLVNDWTMRDWADMPVHHPRQD